jgi:hypothetical protein
MRTKAMTKTIEEILAPKPEARPRIYAYAIHDKAHKGLLKVGQTTRDVKQRIAEQVKTAAIKNYKIELDESAVRDDGTIFSDHHVRAALIRKGFENSTLEWVRSSVADVKTVLTDLFLPNVAACQAMANLLAEKHNTFWCGYKVIVAAGAAAGIGLDTLPPVHSAIGSGFDTKTITLSCGKLTTGVTVPQLSSILMLRNLKSPETYFQAAFRVQSPWSIKNPNGDNPNEEEILKPVCFVFDFASTRALRHCPSMGLVSLQASRIRRALSKTSYPSCLCWLTTVPTRRRSTRAASSISQWLEPQPRCWLVSGSPRCW